MTSPDPRSDRSGGDRPDTDALAVDALPDEVRLHGEGDETEQSQTSTAGPDPTGPEPTGSEPEAGEEPGHDEGPASTR